MKIAYCIPSLYYPSGMERVLTLKANYLVRHYGHEVHIILTDGADRKPYYPLDPAVRMHNLHLDFDAMYGMPFHRKLLYYLRRQRQFRPRLDRCLNEIRPDITVSLLRRDINLLDKMTDGSVKLGELHFSRHDYRDFNNMRLPGWMQRIVAGFWQGQLLRKLRRLKRFVVLSRQDAELWAPDLKNVVVIHNPLSFPPGRQSDCTQKQVIAVGRYVPQKGFDLLIDAWRRVAERHPDWVLRIYGDGMRDTLQAQIDALELTRNCLLEHSTPDIAEKFRESSVFVLSSRYEGFGMVITEAMACGVPPVSFACPCGPRDIITDGEDGLLIPPSDTEKLAEGICRLIEDDELRRRMGSAARKNVERFRIEPIMAQWNSLFEEVLYENRN